jgi:hypothetical protein
LEAKDLNFGHYSSEDGSLIGDNAALQSGNGESISIEQNLIVKSVSVTDNNVEELSGASSFFEYDFSSKKAKGVKKEKWISKINGLWSNNHDLQRFEIRVTDASGNDAEHAIILMYRDKPVQLLNRFDTAVDGQASVTTKIRVVIAVIVVLAAYYGWLPLVCNMLLSVLIPASIDEFRTFEAGYDLWLRLTFVWDTVERHRRANARWIEIKDGGGMGTDPLFIVIVATASIAIWWFGYQ